MLFCRVKVHFWLSVSLLRTLDLKSLFIVKIYINISVMPNPLSHFQCANLSLKLCALLNPSSHQWFWVRINGSYCITVLLIRWLNFFCRERQWMVSTPACASMNVPIIVRQREQGCYFTRIICSSLTWSGSSWISWHINRSKLSKNAPHA